MRKTRSRKFSVGIIYHTILKKAKSTFVPGFPILPNEQQYDNFGAAARRTGNAQYVVPLDVSDLF
jgi:hypothetical protein